MGLDLTEPDILYHDRVDGLAFEITRAASKTNARILDSAWGLGHFEIDLNLNKIII